MRGLKRKRCKFTRRLDCKPPSRSNQKVSCFDFQAYQEQNDLIPTASVQQIRTAITPAKSRSPVAKVKRDRKNLQAAVKIRNTQISLLKAKSERDQQKIITLKNCNNQLMMDILRERRALNQIIDKRMIEARQFSAKAFEMMIEADRTSAEAQAQAIAEQNFANARVCK
jgi:hypothetical protein